MNYVLSALTAYPQQFEDLSPHVVLCANQIISRSAPASGEGPALPPSHQCTVGGGDAASSAPGPACLCSPVVSISHLVLGVTQILCWSPLPYLHL
ncbi:hypothetical protein J6590_061872 [Homalodisca vitripennis]|nr:hypothetical protein J6590_061872 [Homalodisca vitripennis]